MHDVIVQNIFKTYNKGKTKAVNNVSFNVEKGELFGLIGPDGGGKTSIFRMLTTLLLPDSGTVKVNNFDIIKDYKKIRHRVGYMPGKFSLYQDLTVKENINFFATLFKTSMKENYDVIKEIYEQLEPFKNRRAGQLSGGMKQKLALCCVLIHKPSVLFLDEPTTGVDAVSRKEFWHILKRLKKLNITILVSTPYMDEATLCERIALIQNGKIMSIDTPENIIKSYAKNLFAIKAKNMGKLLSSLRLQNSIESSFAFGECHHITFVNNEENIRSKLIDDLSNEGHKQVEIFSITPSIEDCFIKLMNK